MADSTVLNEKEGKDVVTTQETANAAASAEGNTNSAEHNDAAQDENKSNDNDTAKGNTAETSTEPNNDTNGAEPQINLTTMTLDHILSVMSTPTKSHKEIRMQTFIILWARRNNVKYEFDSYGNIYLTKGKIGEGEFYPCVTSHMDTVQDGQVPYVNANAPLPLKIEKETTKDGVTHHKLSVESKTTSIGIGADDKGGICICLGMFEHLDTLKACFFVEEEVGCLGSKSLDKDWFNDVGYVIGFDSPERTRAAWKSQGTQLFSYDFYVNCMKDVCDKYGLKNCFYSEPYTDVREIRLKTDIMCMNFGNGGYNAHASSEYCIIEEMDMVCAMGVDLVKHIGKTQHLLSCNGSTITKTVEKNANGIYVETVVDDTAKLEALGDSTRRGWGSYSTSHSSTTYTSTPKKDDVIKHDVVKYIVKRYESQISGIKDDLIAEFKKMFDNGAPTYADVEKAICEAFSNEIKF